MKARDEIGLSVLRGLLSAFTNELVARRRKPNEELSDDDAIAVIKKQAKQRRDSIEQFRNGKERISPKRRKRTWNTSQYLPEEMSKEEVEIMAKAKKKNLE